MTFPRDPFAEPQSSFPTPIKPIGVGPLEPPLVSATFNYKWCGVIVGALAQLLQQTTWDVDTQAQLTAIQEDVFDLMAHFCVNPPLAGVVPNTGTDGDDLMLRQNPDNPCELQSSIDGITWCTWADLSKCQPLVTQPGAGTPQPAPGGGCQTYHAVLPANGEWLLPAPVNSGDTITVTNAKGATNDGTVSPWACPDGSTFFAGACIGGGGSVSGDPDPSVNHLALLGHVGSLYFPVLGGAVTLPGGIAFGQLTFQVNDSILADNLGSIEFDVEVCNNLAAGWSHTLDFRLTDGMFVLTSDGGTFRGVWQAGVGWNYTDQIRPAAGGDARGQLIHRSGISPFTITEISMIYDYTQGSPSTLANYGIHIAINNGTSHDVITKIQSALTNGTNQTVDSGPISFAGVVEIDIETACSFTAAGGGFSGNILLKQLIIRGTGTDPF